MNTLGSLKSFALVSLLLHMVIGGLAWYYEQQAESSYVASQQVLKNMSLGLKAASVGIKTTQNTMQTSSFELTEADKQPNIKPEPKISSNSETLKSKSDEIKPQPKLRPVARIAPSHKMVNQSKASSPEVTKMVGEQGIDGSTISQNKASETGQDERGKGTFQAELYDALIRKHLLAKQRYPKSLKMKRLEGKVTVSFLINRQGKILQSSIVKMARHSGFNKATRYMLNQAEPFPPAPLESNWYSRSYQIEISYAIQ
ncbi:energy transducer TonB [Shewanella algae]|uniref:energy transducer TonB n=1 Tax=Shewanella algae TaxID=38313 RepID=UPI000B8B7956|nr:TonB family protein [Shewanella algae]OXS00435.1 hypothetical protein AMR44_11735 [Shewanella algae]